MLSDSLSLSPKETTLPKSISIINLMCDLITHTTLLSMKTLLSTQAPYLCSGPGSTL